jgi:hypothetical protein
VSELAKLQSVFWRMCRGEIEPATASSVFEDDEHWPARDRIELYRSMFFARQLDALADAFPRTLNVLGGAHFAELARAYVLAHPSDDPRLEALGRALPEFLRARVGTPHVADLAALEWARTCAFLAADPPGIAGGDAIDPATFAWSSFRFVPAFALVETETDAAGLWEAAESPGAEIELDALARPTVAIVSRRGVTVFHAPAAPDEAAALRLARDGASVAALATCFVSSEAPGTTNDRPDPLARMYEVLGRWLAWHLVAEIVPADAGGPS